MALTELARFLPRGSQHNRYLRSGMRPHHRDDDLERFNGGHEAPAQNGDAATLPPALKDPLE